MNEILGAGCLKELKGTYNPHRVEEEVKRFWRIGTIEKKVEESRRNSPLFRFLEGPPTANGYMHVGHVRGRVMKDVALRFEGMRGRNVWRRAGWDCQGLPVEIEVEKNLGLTSKRDIEKIGLEKFVAECNRLVDHYIAHWRTVSERLGVWLDYDQAYETRRDDYIEVVWWTVKKAYDEGLLREDFKVVPFCPRCETPLSGHEVAQGYEVVKDPSVYVKFKLLGVEEEYLLIWTTTPWTLPGDEAVSVNPDFEYANVRVGGETWIIARDLVDRVMGQIGVGRYEVMGTVNGGSLEGLRYSHPLLLKVPAHTEHNNPHDHSVVLGEHVTLEEGTGCVHTAPAHGPEDFEVGKRYGLRVFGPVDQRGRFTEEAGVYSGLFVKDADRVILEDLKGLGLLVWAGELEHEYPLCWRCDAPIIFRADKQWFISVVPIKEKMMEENRGVDWVPKWAGENRFGEWLANSEDWCISRTRIWGTPLNVWQCQNCGERRVVESKEALVKAAKRVPDHLELHRPWIDEVLLECGKCGGEMRRTPFVLDCWLDSGVAHAASVGYPKNQTLFKELFPWDFITEAIDQTRGWFYSLLTTGVLDFGRSPYKRVLCQGHVLDKGGQKMSKSRGNVILAEEALEKWGADPLRLYLLWKAAPEDPLSFDAEELELINRALVVLWNVFSFATTYMTLDAFNPSQWLLAKVESHLRVEDRWILSRCQSTIKGVTEGLEALQLNKAVRALLDFVVDDVSRFYIKAIRRRTWVESEELEKTAAYTTLYEILDTILRLLAPFAPHLSEELYRSFKANGLESVHLADWLTPNLKLVDERLERDMGIAQEVIKASLAARQKRRVKLRRPVESIIVIPNTPEASEALTRLKETLASQLNSKTVTVQPQGVSPGFVQLKVELNFKTLGPKLKAKMQRAVSAAESLSQTAVAEVARRLAEGEGQVTLGEVVLDREDLAVKEVTPEHIVEASFPYGKVFMDLTETPQLQSEALAKEVVRRAQIMRKEMRLNIADYVDMAVRVEGYSPSLIEGVKGYLAREVRARSLKILPPNETPQEREGAYKKEWELDEGKVTIWLERAG